MRRAHREAITQKRASINWYLLVCCAADAMLLLLLGNMMARMICSIKRVMWGASVDTLYLYNRRRFGAVINCIYARMIEAFFV